MKHRRRRQRHLFDVSDVVINGFCTYSQRRCQRQYILSLLSSFRVTKHYVMFYLPFCSLEELERKTPTVFLNQTSVPMMPSLELLKYKKICFTFSRTIHLSPVQYCNVRRKEWNIEKPVVERKIKRRRK